MKKIGSLLMWLLAGFMVIAALVYIPSLSSGILLLCAIIAAPIKPLQELLASKKVRGAAKGGILAILFLISCAIAPTDRVDDHSAADEPSLSIHAVDTPSPVVRSTPSPSETTEASSPPSQTPALEMSESPSQTPAPEVPASPSQTPAPEVPASPSQTPAESGSVKGSGGGNGDADNFDTWNNPEQQQTTAKWVLNTSTMKIHYPSCSSVQKIAPQNYSTSNLSESELISQGYTVCKRCH